MGRHRTTPRFKPPLLIRLVIGSALIFAVSYGISYSIFRISSFNVSSVAGKYADRIKEVLPVASGDSSRTGGGDRGVWSSGLGGESGDASIQNSKPVLRVALLSDSHDDNDSLAKALDMVKAEKIKTVFFLGDYTNFGGLDALKAAKKVMDDSQIAYYSLPGDHDLAASTGPSNFVSVFGKRYRLVELDGMRFILIDNSANFTVVDDAQLKWFTDTLAGVKEGETAFVLMSNPIYSSTGFKLMGENDESVAKQAKLLLSLVRNSKVKAVVAGDSHLSNQNRDTERSDLVHVAVGALAKDRNLQTPRFSILEVYKDMTFQIRDVEL